MATPSKPELACVCRWRRGECDCVSDEFKKTRVAIRQRERENKQDKWLGIGFLVMCVLLGFAVVLLPRLHP